MIRIAFVIGEYPAAERTLREDVARSYASAEVDVGIVPAGVSPYGGLGPAEIQLVAPYYHAAYVQAELEGYDAVVPLGMLDLGVDGGRSLVDIPVIAPCEAVFHVAAQLGDRFGVICYHPSVIPRQRTQTKAYGMEAWVAGRRAVGFHLREMAENKAAVKDAFFASASELIDEDGADVIIAHGVTQCPIHIDPRDASEQLGVPVVEGIGAPIRMAALMVGLGLRHSRLRWPKSKARPKL